jgi:hypothetical protein
MDAPIRYYSTNHSVPLATLADALLQGQAADRGLFMPERFPSFDRRELQRLIRNGDLRTFEGCVKLDELRQRFPSLAIEEGSLLERISFLQETAFSRRVRETVAPDHEDLAARLRKRTADLAVERARAQKYCAILRELAAHVASLHSQAEGDAKQTLDGINQWLLARLEAE